MFLCTMYMAWVERPVVLRAYEADQDLGKEILGTELVHFEATGSMKKLGSSALKSKPRTR